MGVHRALILATLALAASAQIIEFESGGLKYKTLTKNGVTIMFATLPTHVRDYKIMQVAVSNGSSVAWAIKPEDFQFRRDDGTTIAAVPARSVVGELIVKGSRGDVMKLVATYEAGLFGNTRLRSTNGYEARRQNALAEVSSTRLKAAAAASAIAFVSTKLAPGQSTDGAIFYSHAGKSLGSGRLIVNAAGERFEFPADDTH